MHSAALTRKLLQNLIRVSEIDEQLYSLCFGHARPLCGKEIHERIKAKTPE